MGGFCPDMGLTGYIKMFCDDYFMYLELYGWFFVWCDLGLRVKH